MAAQFEFATRGRRVAGREALALGRSALAIREACRVEVAGTPLKLTPQNGGSGLRRYQISFAACPFTLDILDGAILVTNDGKACEIKEADCRADPSGLWGTPELDLDPKKAEEMLGARARVEKTVRGDFRELYDRNKKDKLVRGFVVKEQAGFSSWREEVCRTYGKEFGVWLLRVATDRGAGHRARRADRERRQAARRLCGGRRRRRKRRKGKRQEIKAGVKGRGDPAQPPFRASTPRPGS